MTSYLPTGTVYGVLLNFRAEQEALAPQMNEPPYKAPPQAPVLYVKTANTFSPQGAPIALPAGVQAVEVGATIGLVMGEGGSVAGCVLMNDLSIPHASFYRPPVKYKCLDGFLGIGAALRTDGADPASFSLEVRIDGQTRQRADFSELVRPPAQLLADVADFMTLRAGDVLMLGCNAGRPLARAGQRVDIVAPGFDVLSNTLVGGQP
ncbi:fumarylacetoacetate hydrolase family protein [Variovorax sp.]|uniref:fumarylacetoacetate hydrolase family protein n=1 Tax=Variovorax sp. TaxID=1871043 RepID=UPI002D567854|nr:fumarylacetoacetate hydrolase family protein [Variovorax sp.]HYP85192.1 fumarylacetoacetate hydrolase family protein [Variovorax sp.]